MATTSLTHRRLIVRVVLILAVVALLFPGTVADAAGPAGCQAVSTTVAKQCSFVTKTGKALIVTAAVDWFIYSPGNPGCTVEAKTGSAVYVCKAAKGSTVYLWVFRGVTIGKDIPAGVVIHTG